MTDDYLRDVMAIGQRNQEILELAQAWCKHARRDRGPLGVGIPEQTTGLPISGGSLVCNYAEPPTSFGMQLEHSALDFYRRNCVGCKYHTPTGRVPNLGSWAEGVIQSQEAAAKTEQAAADVREGERDQRTVQRRQVYAQLDAFAAEVLSLVERLDAEKPDPAASEDLITEARLRSQAFTPELVSMLEIEVRRPNMGGCLKALFELHRRTGRPDRAATLRLAISGLSQRSAVDECSDMVGDFAASGDANALETVFEPLVEAAGRHPWQWHTTLEARPKGLVRYHELAPDRVRELLAVELRRGEAWRRSTAAHATRRLLESNPDIAMLMLRPLLEGLKVGDPSHMDSDEASAPAFASAIAAIIAKEPIAADGVIAEYLEGATDEYRSKAMYAYSAVLRGEDRRPTAIHSQTAQIVAERALKVLLHAKEHDLVSAAGSTLEEVCAEFGSDLKINLDIFLGGLVMLAAEEKDLDTAARQLDFFERSRIETRISVARRYLRDAMGSLAGTNPDLVWNQLVGSWEKAEAVLRHEILGILKSAARGARARLPQLLPLIYTAMCSEDQVDRRDGLEILLAIADYRTIELPDVVVELTIAMLGDHYLVVQRSAVKLIPLLNVPGDRRLLVIVSLLAIARAYAGDRLRDNIVQDAIWGALTLAEPNEESNVMAALLAAIDRMPAYNGAETLVRFRRLEKSPRWPPSAVRALRLDEDPQYRGLGDDDRAELIIGLARRPADIGVNGPALLAVGKERGKDHGPSGWAIAELLSSAGQHEAAVELARFVEEQIPDTHEMRHMRRSARQVRRTFEYELWIASGDLVGAGNVLKDEEDEAYAPKPD